LFDTVFFTQHSKPNIALIVIDTYIFTYASCKKSFPEYKELVKSIPEGKFGFTLSKPFLYSDPTDHKEYTIPAGFYEINSNLVFLVGYATPKDLVKIMPSFNFDFSVKQLLDYLRECVDTIFPEFDILTHDDRLELIDFLTMAHEQGAYNTLDFKRIGIAFSDRAYYEEMKKDNTSAKDLDAVLKGIVYKINNC
jgi:hypothetical protein